MAAAAKSRHTTPTASEEDERAITAEDEKTSAGATTAEFSRRSTWHRSMLLNGKSFPAVRSYID